MRDDDANVLVSTLHAGHLEWAINWAAIETASAPDPKFSSPIQFSVPGGQLQNRADHPQVAAWGADKGSDKGKGKSKKDNDANQSGNHPHKQRKLEEANADTTFTVGNKTYQFSKDAVAALKTAEANPSFHNTKAAASIFEVKPLFRDFCRNCFSRGKGLLAHTLASCQQQGNPCNLPCPKCKKGNHWINMCSE